MHRSNRLNALPPYLFAEIDKSKREATASGIDVIDMGIGDPDIPTPLEALDVMSAAIQKYANKFYPPYGGTVDFRNSVATWYRRRSSIVLDPDTEVLALIGSKEGLAHLPFAVTNPGDIVLVPDPEYPVYRNSALLSGAVPYAMPLRVENGFLPIFDDIPHEVASRAVLMYLNYPNNPTGAVADLSFLRSAVEFARKYDIIIAYDHAYSELVFDGRRSPSILEVEGSRELCVEFNSLSKVFNATGWRLAWAVGSREVLESLNSLKKNLDSGVFMAIQEAGAFALDNLIEATCANNVSIYEQRRDVFVQILREGGWDVSPPHGTFYIWARIPGNSCKAAARLLRETGVVCVPGIGYGEYGEGYIRFALNLDVQRVAEAARRLSRAKFPCENGETLVHS